MVEEVVELEEAKGMRMQYRCGPREVINHVRVRPSEERVRLIQQLGFGFVLHMKMKNLGNDLVSWIIAMWDSDTRSIKLDDGRWLFITEDDVHGVYGLPEEPNLVKLGELSTKKAELGRLFGLSCPSRGNVKLKNLKTTMGAEADDEKWVKMYVPLIFSKLFSAKSSSRVTKEYLRFLLLGMVEHFTNFN